MGREIDRVERLDLLSGSPIDDQPADGVFATALNRRTQPQHVGLGVARSRQVNKPEWAGRRRDEQDS